MFVSMVHNTRNHETGFEAGFTVSDFLFQCYQIDRLVSANPTSNPTFGFLIDHALVHVLVIIELKICTET